MSIPRDYPFIRVGDSLGQLQAWRLFSRLNTRTLDDENTNRGRLFITVGSAFPSSAPLPATPATTPSAADSLFSVSAPTVAADGVGFVELLATVRDADEVPLEGWPVQFLSSGSGNILDPAIAVTDANGEARAYFYSTTAEAKTLSAVIDPLGTPLVIPVVPALTFTAAAVPSNIAVISLFMDRDLTLPVAAGRGYSGSRVQLRERGASTIQGSVWLSSAATGAIVQLYVSLASAKDTRGREDRLDEFKDEDPNEVSDFEDIQRSVLRAFYLRLFAIYPPESLQGNPLSFAPEYEIQQAGIFGQVDPSSIRLWTLNVENDYELTGLQNPGDYREWAVTMFQRFAWERRIRGGELDEAQQRVNVLLTQEALAFKGVRPMIDCTQTGRPDRIAEKTGALRFRRG